MSVDAAGRPNGIIETEDVEEKTKAKEPFLVSQFLLPMPSELIDSQQTEGLSRTRSLPGEIYSSDHLTCIYHPKKLTPADSKRKMCTEFLRLSGRAENWV